jgi:hypothetical protein
LFVTLLSFMCEGSHGSSRDVFSPTFLECMEWASLSRKSPPPQDSPPVSMGVDFGPGSLLGDDGPCFCGPIEGGSLVDGAQASFEPTVLRATLPTSASSAEAPATQLAPVPPMDADY